MRIYILTIFSIFFASTLLAQSGNVNLLAQSPDGKTVKLVWFFKSWSSDITGFDIKRKDGLQGWVKLNKEPILPEILVKKKLSIVEADNNEEARLRMKLYKLISAHKLRETDNNLYLQNLNGNDKALQEITNEVLHDYDIALISGFAYIDRTISKKTDYQYGLFQQGTDRLLAKVAWNYGEIPDLNAVKEITTKATTDKNGVQIIWNADVSKIKSADIAGFNIYREGLRLNSIPVQAENSKDITEYMWYDKSANSASSIEYSVSAESIFGIEGIIRSYTYDPADHPAEYKKAEVTEVTSLGYYFKDGISVKWSFPKEFEKFIKGFYVEKANMPEGYKRVSTFLDTTARAFVDMTPSPVSGYIRMRVVAVYNDKTIVPGVERMYSYFPSRLPPIPQDVVAKTMVGDKKVAISISWGKPINGDSITDCYRVYVSDAPGSRFLSVTENKTLRSTNYTYLVDHGSASTYRFCVVSLGKTKVESPFSDTVSVLVPSLDLPAPAFSRAVADTNKAALQWQYPEIPDLKGFRLYQNKTVIANENELDKSMREFKTSKLMGGVTYEYMIRAVAENGVISDYSPSVPVAIPDEFKK